MRRTRSTVRSPLWKDRLLALLLQAVAQRGADAREQFVHAERLGDVIVGAQIERLHLAAFVGAARQHDDRNRRAVLAQVPDDLEAVDVGQAEIEHEKIDRIAFDEAASAVLAVLRFEHLDSPARPGWCAGSGGSAARRRRPECAAAALMRLAPLSMLPARAK